ncbi:putative UDP-glucosyltransferase [Corchorus olitorius]|uniref:UDP-glucosyltransferase n=1 Tax=Corchorus olitorius TaxID=93759 RepID=A0A1R3KMS4_9ROSI|nr:putative UDP-glucosyltransferase [Corchorus olitorius]
MLNRRMDFVYSIERMKMRVPRGRMKCVRKILAGRECVQEVFRGENERDGRISEKWKELWERNSRRMRV